MQTPGTATHAVLTGDLTPSTTLPDSRLDAAMSALERAAKDGATNGLHFTRFRGDGWQVLLPHPIPARHCAPRCASPPR